MKDWFSNIFSNLVSSYIVVFLGAIGSFLVSVFSPTVFPYLIIIVVLLFAFLVFFLFFSFGIAKFKWTYVHSTDTQCLTLKEDRTAIDREQLGTLNRTGFDGIVTGIYYGDDVSIDHFEVKCPNADLSAKIKYADGKTEEITKEKNINICNDPTEVEYEICFANNRAEDVNIDVSMHYDSEIMAPEYFVDVTHPIKKLILELRVQDGVKIRNIRKAISTEFGDSRTLLEKKLTGKKCKDDPSMTSYRFVVHNPHILHRYEIKWNWI